MHHQPGLYWENGRTLFRAEPALRLRRIGWLLVSAAAAALAAWFYAA